MPTSEPSAYGSREDLRRRSANSSRKAGAGTAPNGAALFQPGRQPIGFLAARGTPYQKKYLTRKLGACCLFLAPIVLLVTLAIVLTIVLYAIGANISSIGNTSFPLVLEGQVKKVGIFPAHLYFREDIDVLWMTPPPNMREVHLGTMKLDYLGVAAGHGRLKQATHFNIVDEEAFGEFAAFLIQTEEFTWKLKCPNVHVEAFSFLPTYKNLEFSKNVVIKGINNFGNDVKLLDFQLPGDDPAGGISTTAISALNNPSPFNLQIGTLNLDLFYKDLYIAAVTATGLNLTQGINTVQLSGRLFSQADNASALALMGEIFTGYINGESVPVQAKGRSTQQENGDIISWLSTGIKALEVQIPLKSPNPINPIKGITINYLSLVYDAAMPYNPTLSSDSLVGQLGLPFGFSLDIVSLATLLNIEYNGVLVGSAESDFSNSSTHLDVISAGQTAGNITLTIPPTMLKLPNTTDDAREELIIFQNAFTFSEKTGFVTKGSAKAVTDTPIGRVLLNGIAFDVGTGLLGLQSLTKYPTLITSVDVTGGTTDAIALAVGTALVNPSNLNLTVGSANFLLANSGVNLGNVTLPNLNLKIGENNVAATSFFDPNRDPKGLETLNRFVSGQDTALDINGFSGSSDVESLVPTFSNLRLNTTLPGLQVKLVQGANLTVLDTTAVVDNVANSIVGLNNPFTASLNLQHISAKVSAAGVFIADIDTSLNFPAAGKQVSASPNIPLALNLFPPDLFAVVRAFAIKSGQDPAPLDGVVQLGGYTYTATSGADGTIATKRDAREESFDFEEENEGAQLLMGVGSNPGALVAAADEHHSNVALRNVIQKRNLYTGFDLPTYIRRAFSVAEVDLVITADTLIGDYGTSLTISQTEVPLGTDETLDKLLPPLAAPIVQKIVDQAILNIDTVTIQNPQPDTFSAVLQGSLLNSGPFDAVVSFPQGLTIFWEGQELVQAAFPDIQLTGDVGAAINVQLEAQVPSVDYLTEFTKYLILNKSFVWNIKAEGIAVSALGINVTGISLDKSVQLTGFDGLKGMVIINSFDLPSNSDQGGLALTAATTINNPSQVGLALSSFGVSIARNDTVIGPSQAAQAFTLAPLSTTTLPLAGRLQEQTSSEGLAILSEIFTRFVHNQNTDVVVNGVSAGPSDVVWLNEGIKALSVVVVLPSQDFQVIRLISLNQLSLFFTEDTAWSPATSSNDTEAHFFLPFGFPLDIVRTGGNFIANYENEDAAVLNVPQGASTTDVQNRILTLMFENVPFEVYGNRHSVFSQFLADTTAMEQVTFNLNGAASANAQTNAGLITITDIPFDLNTNLLGLQNLNARPAIVSDLDVVHGYPDYLEITINVALFNPSDITIGTGTVQFDVLFQDNLIGEAVITDLVLVPGVNVVPTALRYMPEGSRNVASGQLLLENYVQNITSTAVVQGTRDTTPIASLKQALSGITLQTEIPSLGKLIITRATLTLPTDIAQRGIGMVTVDVSNPFTASINILKIEDTTATYEGILLATINVDLSDDPIRAPGKQTTTSQEIDAAIDIDPKNLINFIFAAAQNTGTDLGPLPKYFNQVLALPNTDTAIEPYPDSFSPPCNSGTAFDTLGAILKLLQGLATRLDIQSTLKLDDYQTDLDFVQNPVPTITDETALYLVGPVAAPIVQLAVDASTLSVSIANATSLTDDGFDLALAGALILDAPADAYVVFTEPLTVNWQGKDIATIALPPLCSAAYVGIPDLQTSGRLTITNLGDFEEFTEFILHNESFEWTLSSNNLTAYALGIRFEGVQISKTITLDAFNNLPGVTITSFDIPSDTDNALNIVVGTDIPSPASLGIELDTANFKIYFMDTYIGPVHSTDLFLAAKATTATVLMGQITAKSGKGLVNTGILFSNYLQGKNQTLQVTGDSVVTEAQGGEVSWLTKAFKTLTLDVILPGMIYQIIFSIAISDLTVDLTGNPDAVAYNAPTSTNETLAVFANPFNFRLTPTDVASNITISYNGGETAQLDIPSEEVKSGTSTGPDDRATITLTWDDVPLRSLNDGNYNSLFACLTDTARCNLDLVGEASIVAETAIGALPISGIPFSNITSPLDGINSFNNVVGISNVTVAAGNPQFIEIPLNVELTNPSEITLFTKDISLPVLYEAYEVGRAIIPSLSLAPGDNMMIKSVLHYQPAGANDTKPQDLLNKYLQPPGGTTGTQSANLVIDGSSKANSDPLSPYGSLIQGLEGVTLRTTLDGIGTRIVQTVRVFIELTSICSGAGGKPEVSSIVTSLNDLPVNLAITKIDAQIQKTGTNDQPSYAQFDHDFNPAYMLPAAVATNQPSGGPVASEKIPNILLNRGLLASLDILGSNLDLYLLITVNVGSDDGGYTIPGLQYQQINVPTTYDVSLLGETLGDVVSGGALLSLLNGKLLEGTFNGLEDILKCLPGILQSDPTGASQLLGGLQKGLCTVVGTAANLPLLGGLLQAAPALGPVVQRLCPSANTTSSSTTASSSTTSLLPSLASDASSVVSSITSVAASVVSTVTAALASEASVVASDVQSAVQSGAGAAGGAVSSVVGDLTGGLTERAMPAPSAPPRVRDL